MLTEKQYRERARADLRKIQTQALSLAADRDLYRKFEQQVVQTNPQLRNARSPFLDMLRAVYTDAMAARVLRLLDGEEGSISLAHVLDQLEDRPELRHDKIGDREFMNDRARLQQAAERLRGEMDVRTAHHERTLPALASVHRELDAAIDCLLAVLKTYYWVITDTYLDLDVHYSEEPMEIFRTAWLELRAE